MFLRVISFISLIISVQAQQIIPPRCDYTKIEVVSPWQEYSFKAYRATSEEISFRFLDSASCSGDCRDIGTTVDFLINGQQVNYDNGTFVALRGLTKVWVWSEGDIIKLCGAPWRYESKDGLKRKPNLTQVGLLVTFDPQRKAYVATNIGRIAPSRKIYLNFPDYAIESSQNVV